jgi:predicted nucleotidyltransferase
VELPSYFKDFLSEIRLTDDQRKDLITGHRTLRKRLLEDEQLAPAIVSTFLQGSYRRATAIRPKADKRSDVDVIVVTKLLMEEYTNPQRAMELFLPFLEKHYKGKYELQGRSIGIKLSYVDLDLVITAAPSESEQGILRSPEVVSEDTPEPDDLFDPISENQVRAKAAFWIKEIKQEPQWKISPLYIPDRDAQEWVPTHPLEQIRWTWEKNSNCNYHYVNVVKAIKWWRRSFSIPKYPKGYPIEHLTGQYCPDGI